MAPRTKRRMAQNIRDVGLLLNKPQQEENETKELTKGVLSLTSSIMRLEKSMEKASKGEKEQIQKRIDKLTAQGDVNLSKIYAKVESAFPKNFTEVLTKSLKQPFSAFKKDEEGRRGFTENLRKALGIIRPEDLGIPKNMEELLERARKRNKEKTDTDDEESPRRKKKVEAGVEGKLVDSGTDAPTDNFKKNVEEGLNLLVMNTDAMIDALAGLSVGGEGGDTFIPRGRGRGVRGGKPPKGGRTPSRATIPRDAKGRFIKSAEGLGDDAARAISQAAPKGVGARAFGMLGRIATPLTVGLGVVEGVTDYRAVESARQQGLLTDEEATVQKSVAVGGAAGGVGGALAGGQAGAALGATIGSAVPLVGTAIGGIAGGLIGGTAGYFLGRKGGSMITEAGTEAVLRNRANNLNQAAEARNQPIVINNVDNSQKPVQQIMNRGSNSQGAVSRIAIRDVHNSHRRFTDRRMTKVAH